MIGPACFCSRLRRGREEDTAAVLVQGDGVDEVREMASTQGFIMLGMGC